MGEIQDNPSKQNNCYNTTQPLSQNNSQNCERNPQPKNQIRLWRHHHKLHYSHLSFWRYLYYTIPSQHLVSANSPKIEWYGLCIWGYLCSTSERSDNKRVIRCTTKRALNLFPVNILGYGSARYTKQWCRIKWV
jgi:hypothetical protein